MKERTTRRKVRIGTVVSIKNAEEHYRRKFNSRSLIPLFKKRGEGKLARFDGA